MATLAPPLLSFNGGEWSPLVLARSDLPKYTVGAGRLENFIPLVEGPVTRRPGFRHVAPVRGHAAAVRLIRFVFSADQTYVIEATDLRLRFYRNRAPIVEAARSITGITQANPAVVTAPGHGYANGDEVIIEGVGGMADVNLRRFKAAGVGTNTFQLQTLDGQAVNSTGYGAYSSGGTARRVYTLTTDYTAAQLPGLSVAQSKDVLYIGCAGKRIRKLTRFGDTNWTITDFAPTDGPYLPENGTENWPQISGDGGGAGSSVTIQFQNTQGINGGAGFSSADLGRLIRAARRESAPGSDSSENLWCWFQITAITDSRTVTATAKTRVGYEYGSIGLRRRWRLGMWSDAMGWPSKLAIFQGRLWAAETATYPLHCWASESDGYESFAPTPYTIPSALPTPTPASAFLQNLGGGEGNLLRWLLPLSYLVVGSAGDERSVRGSDLEELVTFDNAANRLASNNGVHSAQPERVDSSGLYITRDGRRLMELLLDGQVANYASIDLTLYAKHLGMESRFAELAFQRRPWRVCWARREDGALLGMTYDRSQEVLGCWHRHPLGGRDAKVLAMTSIPGDGQDELWLVVERTIGSQTRRHVEVMTYEQPLGQADARNFCYLDASLSYDGEELPAGTVIRGLEHLAGETVKVLADGALHADVTVSSIGTVVLTRPASVAHVGYGYRSLLETLPLELGNPSGAGLGRPKTAHHLTLLLVESIGGGAGPRADKLEPIKIRRVGDASDAPPALLTERRRLAWPGGFQDALPLVIAQELPFPMTLAAAVPGYSTNEA